MRRRKIERTHDLDSRKQDGPESQQHGKKQEDNSAGFPKRHAIRGVGRRRLCGTCYPESDTSYQRHMVQPLVAYKSDDSPKYAITTGLHAGKEFTCGEVD